MHNRGDPDRGTVQAEWEAAFGATPPPFLSVLFMRKALVHETQRRARGGLSPATRRSLNQIASGKPVKEVVASTFRPGETT